VRAIRSRGRSTAEDLDAIQPSRLREALAINNHGLVVGYVRWFDQKNHATVWRLPSETLAGPNRVRSR
jgi:hypothetical protein